MEKLYKFNAVIKKSGNIDAAYIEFPYDVEKEFGSKGGIKVKAAFNGVEYRGSLVKMNTECHIIGVLKDIRKKIGKTFGDTIEVTIIKDTEERIVEIPAELKVLFEKHPEIKVKFNKLSYTERKEIARNIESAKKDETRKKRVEAVKTKLL